MSLLRRLIVLLGLAAALVAPALAAAHPLGNFSVNHYTRAELSGGSIYLRYVLDMAEIPTFQEREAVDAAGGLGPYATRRARALAGDLVVTVDGRRLAAEPASQVARLLPGQAGLRVLRLAAWYRVPAAERLGPGPHAVVVRDETYAGRLGWRELLVRTSDGARAAGDAVPTEDVSDELRDYPQDLLAKPLTVASTALTWTPGSGTGSVAALTSDPESQVEETSSGGVAGLVEGDLSVGVVLLALVLAMGWGALHSLSPGHGKSMVAAYLVGTRGTARHAFLLGGFVTVTHVIGVIALGLVTLLLSQYLLPETLYPWLTLVAALLVLVVGLWALRGRIRRARAGRAAHRRHPHHDHHAHVHVPAPAPELALVHAGGHEEAGHADVHTHDHGHRHHTHDHGHDHAHGQDHDHTHDHPGHAHDHGHDHDHAHDHHHGPGGHSHAPPSDLSLKSLMAVGATAGIIPCPSALVLLLGAIALQRVGYGLVLVLAFSIGLAAVISVIGLLVLYARRLVDRVPLDGRVAAMVPLASGLIIVGLGVWLTVKAIPGVL